MDQTTQRRRAATPDRWQKALARAIAGRVRVAQLGTTGQWIATSGSAALGAYELDVVGNVARGCACPAGEHGDPVCLHRAAYYHAVGLLHPADAPCAACAGEGCVTKASVLFGTTYRVDCRACGGRGARPPVVLAA